jgi:nucleoside-diphosphate-sugar epimerase
MLRMKKRNQSVLVIGVNGYIGNHLASRLLSEGYQVTGLSGSGSIITHHHYHHINMRIAGPFFLRHYDVIYHFAGIGYGYAQSTESFLYNQHISLLKHILQSIKEPEKTIFVYPSSASVYGQNLSTTLSEESELLPITTLGKIKLKCEEILLAHCKKTNMRWLVGRLFNVYGENDRFSIISKIYRALSTNTTMTIGPDIVRDFVHIKDVVSSLVYLSNYCSGTYNIGSGIPTRLGDLITTAENLFRRKISLESHQLANPHVVADITQLLNTGYQFERDSNGYFDQYSAEDKAISERVA